MTDLPKGPSATELHARTRPCAHTYWTNDQRQLQCTKCGKVDPIDYHGRTIS